MFERTTQDATTHNMDACCGRSSMTLNGVPEPDTGFKIRVYARCENCGALWRDGFKNSDVMETTYTGPDRELEDVWYTLDTTISHVDKNKLHDGRAVLVEHPQTNPADYYIEKGYYAPSELDPEDHKPEYYEQRTTYVHRYCEVDADTVSPVTIGSTYLYDYDGTETDVIISDLTFDEEYSLQSITFYPVREGDSESVTVSVDEFRKSAEFLHDEEGNMNVISRPKM